jgi:hypothetical protein
MLQYQTLQLQVTANREGSISKALPYKAPVAAISYVALSVLVQLSTAFTKDVLRHSAYTPQESTNI